MLLNSVVIASNMHIGTSAAQTACPHKGTMPTWGTGMARTGARCMAIWEWICCRVLEHHANTLENDLTKWFMATFGWRRVRGGDFVKTEADPDDLWWLPLEFRQNKKGTISFRNVLKLRLGAMTKFPSELRGLVDSFLASGRPQHPYQLNTDTFPKPFLC